MPQIPALENEFQWLLEAVLRLMPVAGTVIVVLVLLFFALAVSREKRMTD